MSFGRAECVRKGQGGVKKNCGGFDTVMFCECRKTAATHCFWGTATRSAFPRPEFYSLYFFISRRFSCRATIVVTTASPVTFVQTIIMPTIAQAMNAVFFITFVPLVPQIFIDCPTRSIECKRMSRFLASVGIHGAIRKPFSRSGEITLRQCATVSGKFTSLPLRLKSL